MVEEIIFLNKNLKIKIQVRERKRKGKKSKLKQIYFIETGDSTSN